MAVIDITREMIRILTLEGNAVLSCADRLQRPEAGLAAEKAIGLFETALSKGGKIVVTGVGKSGKVGQKIAATFCSTGSLSVYVHPTEGLHGDLGLISPKDAVLALSYTGNTEELCRLVPSIRTLGVPIVGLGGNAHSQLAEQCDVWLDGFVESEACPHNLAPTSSTTLALALGDALAITLMQKRGFDADSFAQNHPGGSLGKRLTLRVRDLMHEGSSVAVVSLSASMDEVVIASTLKKLGAVLIVDGTRLLGLITDGDLRRALQHRERFFSLRASEVMTREPVTVGPDALARDALELMENRSSQISVLPVVNAEGDWKGVLRLHDLVRSF